MQHKGRGLLLVDRPNVHETLRRDIWCRKDHEPLADDEKIDLVAVRDWLVDHYEFDPESFEACVFTNVHDRQDQGLQNYILHMIKAGFRFFAKPKVRDNRPSTNGNGKSKGSDIDDEMRQHGEAFLSQIQHGDHLFVMGNDFRNMGGLLERVMYLSQHGETRGIAATVLCFEEFTRNHPAKVSYGFLDLRDIPGAFKKQPPRLVNLASLPEEGQWYELESAPRVVRIEPQVPTPQSAPETTLLRSLRELPVSQPDLAGAANS